MKADKKKVEKIGAVSPDTELISFIEECFQSGEKYRDKFKQRWDTIEKQIRCVHPKDWDEKESWQTKVFIPQQSKKVDTANAYLDKMIFGNKQFFSIKGEEKRDKEKEGYIEELFSNIFNSGGFSFENEFVLNEAASIGTSFIKIIVNPKRNGLIFKWRSPYNLVFDPNCGHDLSTARYIIDEYRKSIHELIEDVKKGKSLYGKESVMALIDKAEEIGRTRSEDAIAVIKSIDGTDARIAKEYLDVYVREFWGITKEKKELKNKKDEPEYIYQEKIVTVANGTVILRNDINDYGFKPFFWCRIKPRKYDSYAFGFCENTVDLQELTNSMICLGFDSLKMCSMDMGFVDVNMVKDPSSIQYKPMAIWKLKGNPNQAVKLGRQGISALRDILQGLTILDQFDQEASGVLRQVQGAPQLSGSQGETLGEYQAKLAMIDNRFLKIARFIERDYIEPMLTGVFQIVFNPKFFNQNLIDRILGLKEEMIEIPDPVTGLPVQIMQQMPKLNFDEIASQGDMKFDFKAVGMTQFSKSMSELQKLKELLQVVLTSPDIKIISKIDEIFKRVMQAADIEDFEDLIKSDEEIKKIMDQIYGIDEQQQQQQNQGGMQLPPELMQQMNQGGMQLPPELMQQQNVM